MQKNTISSASVTHPHLLARSRSSTVHGKKTKHAFFGPFGQSSFFVDEPPDKCKGHVEVLAPWRGGDELHSGMESGPEREVVNFAP